MTRAHTAPLPMSRQATAVLRFALLAYPLLLDPPLHMPLMLQPPADAAGCWNLRAQHCPAVAKHALQDATHAPVHWLHLQGNEDVLHSKSTMRRGPHLKSMALV